MITKKLIRARIKERMLISRGIFNCTALLPFSPFERTRTIVSLFLVYIVSENELNMLITQESWTKIKTILSEIAFAGLPQYSRALHNVNQISFVWGCRREKESE